MKNFKLLFAVIALAMMSCAPESMKYYMKRYTLDFEGAYWDALVDSSVNGDNLLGGAIARVWHDEKSDLVGEILEPYTGYWEGAAISSYCSVSEDEGTKYGQLYAFVEKPYSGKNFLICNGFLNSAVELRFDSKTSFFESMMVANTTYSRNATGSGYATATRPLGDKESIWIEAKGYVNGSDEVQATAKFYLYKNGKPAFEGWKKWYMTSMCKVDRVVFCIEWDGEEEYNPYPAYFALDDIVVVRQELIEKE